MQSPSHESRPDANRSMEKSAYWFADGNVILQAGDRGFRIHTSLLSRHSVFFRELFELPQTSPEMIDGCVVVQVHDPPGDIEILLSALYDGCTFNVGAKNRLPFSTVACLIRLGHKYQMESILTGAISRLKTCFPALYADACMLRNRRSSYMSFKDEDAVAVVNLARLTQTGIVLPGALFVCALLPNELLLHGVPRGDGTMERLAPEDIVRCLNGRECLVRAARTRFEWLLLEDMYTSDDCSQEEECQPAMERMAKDIARQGLLSNIDFLNVMLAGQHETNNMCVSCRQMLDDDDNNVCVYIWSNLPEYMGVPVKDWGKPDAQDVPIES
ncbi:uncharacterized protein C8Q71DRAFT_203514 [Rhodofomes roseus]|uniref:BTB domain-containing protein n=1 Tax=Rhodofomes roseus TaxID=34475 RepID=A0ABQ8KTZ9_9APHY|nr:uncharacterized protein C8Q71DRAFT_203514 [Rhodofomes roseus]KAH9842444.1 hypothetical protein C8Q71DRAFT_203514 [Rhodofomes roseus]